MFLEYLLDAMVAILSSALSGMGVGGGSVFLLYLTEVKGMEQTVAQGVNLLCFLAAGLGAIPFYLRLGMQKKRKLFLWIVAIGIPFVFLGAWVAMALPRGWVRRIFGAFLIVVSLSSLIKRKRKKNGED